MILDQGPKIPHVLRVWSKHKIHIYIYIYFYLFLPLLGLSCFVQAFSGFREQRLLSPWSAWTSHCGGFSSCRAQALGERASVVTALRLSSCGAGA